MSSFYGAVAKTPQNLQLGIKWQLDYCFSCHPEKAPGDLFFSERLHHSAMALSLYM